MSGRKKKSTERERKFLVTQLRDLSGYKHTRIQQGYIVVTDDTEVRIRKRGSDHTLGIKKGSGEIRREDEIRISRTKFDALWSLTQGMRIYKTRYEIPYHGVKIELDIYSGKLKGLKTAEIEFKSSRWLNRLKLPDWIGKDVTGKREYSNSSLAKSGLSKTRNKS